MAVIGLDLSLASTGLALVDDGQIVAIDNIKTKGRRGASYDEWLARIGVVYDQTHDTLKAWADDHAIDLAVIEAPSFGSQFGNPHERAGLWWKVYERLDIWGVRIKTLAPKSRAKYITNNGNADKGEVLIAAQSRWGDKVTNHDIADAVGLAMWGQELGLELDG